MAEPTAQPWQIRPLVATDCAGVARLWRAYHEQFAASLGPQDLAAQAARIVEDYRLPMGRLWVAVVAEPTPAPESAPRLAVSAPHVAVSATHVPMSAPHVPVSAPHVPVSAPHVAVVACGAWKRFDGEACELKRMVVDAAWRGRGLGRAVAQAVVEDAWRHGARRILLDTTPEMVAARSLYASLGFREIPAYYEGPLRRPVFMALEAPTAGPSVGAGGGPAPSPRP